MRMDKFLAKVQEIQKEEQQHRDRLILSKNERLKRKKTYEQNIKILLKKPMPKKEDLIALLSSIKRADRANCSVETCMEELINKGRFYITKFECLSGVGMFIGRDLMPYNLYVERL